MVKSSNCDQENVIVFLKKIERLESRVRQLELDKENIYQGLERLYEKLEEMTLKVK